MTHPHVAPSIGRPICSPDDARELWRKHFGDRAVPADNPRVPRRSEQAWRERVQRSQLAALTQRLAAVDGMSMPEVERAWADAFRTVRALFGSDETTDTPKGIKHG
ncbi:hypothetical protein [Nocardia sp. R7R-8]|uniref:hypothetical protein n=1 Tax=Nocardia sp. R7R-8 TaxID=3459304 RepID=UPI00403DB4BA